MGQGGGLECVCGGNAVRPDGGIPMKYTKFCQGYSRHTAANKLTNHLEHKPGIVTEVDWSGPTMHYVDTATGELLYVYLFAATLPYSQYSFVEPCPDTKLDSWIYRGVKRGEKTGFTGVSDGSYRD